MGFEIERKFRLDSSQILQRLMQEGLQLTCKELEQIYTKISPDKTVRFRYDGDKIVKTIKKGTGLVRQEDEEEVFEEEYKKARKRALGVSIKKKRYSFNLQNFKACIDCFEDSLEGLVFLEVEFPTESEANAFKLPPAFEAVEVTDDPFYSNAMLALYGWPKEPKSVKVLFEAIEQDQFQIEDINAHMSAYDAFRTLFYWFYTNIKRHKQLYLQTQDNEALHQFRVNLRKTRSLLQVVPNLLDPAITKRFIDGFKQLASKTNTKRDLDVFKEYLEANPARIHLDFHISKNRAHEDEVLTSLLTSKATDSFFNEWQMVIEDWEGFFQGHNASLPFKALAAMAILIEIEALIAKLKRLNEASALKRFHKIRIEFKRLRYLLEISEHLFATKALKKAIKKAKVMQELFGTLQDRDIQRSVLRDFEDEPILSEDVEAVAAIEELLVQINNEIYGLKTEILCKKKKLIKRLKKCIGILEPYKI
jgi:CHAD domain-containing protein/CYTH domain-containing protein